LGGTAFPGAGEASISVRHAARGSIDRKKLAGVSTGRRGFLYAAGSYAVRAEIARAMIAGRALRALNGLAGPLPWARGLGEIEGAIEAAAVSFFSRAACEASARPRAALAVP